MRPTLDERMLTVARVIAEGGTCARRKVGCVLVSATGKILSTGHNGNARGLHHCTDKHCPGVDFTSGQGLDKCEAIHAEQNALLQCADVEKIYTCFVTVSPCIHCIKMLMNTGCNRIVFLEEYPNHAEAYYLWSTLHGGGWVKFQYPHPREFGNLKW